MKGLKPTLNFWRTEPQIYYESHLVKKYGNLKWNSTDNSILHVTIVLTCDCYFLAWISVIRVNWEITLFKLSLRGLTHILTCYIYENCLGNQLENSEKLKYCFKLGGVGWGGRDERQLLIQDTACNECSSITLRGTGQRNKDTPYGSASSNRTLTGQKKRTYLLSLLCGTVFIILFGCSGLYFFSHTQSVSLSTPPK